MAELQIQAHQVSSAYLMNGRAAGQTSGEVARQEPSVKIQIEDMEDKNSTALLRETEFIEQEQLNTVKQTIGNNKYTLELISPIKEPTYDLAPYMIKHR